jgi:subtilase family serine protease
LESEVGVSSDVVFRRKISGENPMRCRRSIPLYILAVILLSATAAKPQAVAPTVQIVNRIDENDLTTLKGNTHPLANAMNDRGPVSPSLPMTDLIMLLNRSAEQQAAFDKFVANQYDPHSPDFHHWLEPAQVGENFGPSQTDIQTISNWLTGHGFSVDAVSKDRMTIRFSGTAGQVQSAFHTEIHNLEVGGVAHIGNMSDPQIPAALVPAVVGVKALHNFFPKPMHKLGSKVQFNREAGKWQRIPGTAEGTSVSAKAALASRAHPEFASNISGGGLEEDVAPYDFATIYNVLPLWNKGTDGTGQTIAIAGTSDITLSDVTTFRSTFGLPAYTSSNAPKVTIVHGADPVCTNASDACDGDLTENTLDVEWSGAVAKGAQIVLVVAGSTSSSDDTLYDAEQYIVDNATAPVMSVSYGLCELFNGTASNATYNSMWQTAASEKIAVFVASGDAGSALCDDGMDQQYGTPWSAQYGLAVNGLASSQYDTAVGGTDFNWGTTASPYWSSTNNSTTGASALGYVPEVPWNDTCTNPLELSNLETLANEVKYTGKTVANAETACNFIATDSIYVFNNYTSGGEPADISGLVDTVGGGGGESTCSTNTTTNTTVGKCTSGHAKPSWQAGLTSAYTGRDLPDVSFFASNGFFDSAYLICVSLNGACVTSTAVGSEPYAQEIGGTSVASPAMAGVMALINQNAGSAQGSPNQELYTLAGNQTYSGCSAESVTSGSTSCYFNDIDTGTISMPCDYGAADGGIVIDASGNPSLVAQQPGIKSPNCTPKYSGDTVGILAGVDAGTGYDLATGLGSLNVANVANAWTASSTPSFSISGPSVSFAAGATSGNTSTISITPANAFTGTVDLSCKVTTAPSGATSPITCSIPASVSVTGTPAVTATLTVTSTSTTTVGAYAVTVTGTSGSLTETGVVDVTVTGVVGPNATFTMSAPATSTPASVSPGGTAVDSVTLAAVDGYAGTVTFTCTQASGPTNTSGDAPSCVFSTAAAAMGSSTSFTVNTIAAVASSELTWPKAGGKGRGWTGAGALLALLVFFGIPSRRRSWRSMLGMLVALAVLGSLAACTSGGGGGGGNQGNPGTAAGTYTFTVTGTGNPAPAVAAQPVTFTVVVN